MMSNVDHPKDSIDFLKDSIDLLKDSLYFTDVSKDYAPPYQNSVNSLRQIIKSIQANNNN